MPSLYFIVRFEAANESKSSCRTRDITITGLPAALEADTTRTVKTYTVIDEEVAGGPWTYRVAFDIINMNGKDVHVSYGSVSRDDALHHLKEITDSVKEHDAERVKNDNMRNKDPEDDIYDAPDSNDKAEIQWEDDTCIKIRLRRDSFLWYKLYIVDVEDRANWRAKEPDVQEGGDKKRRKMDIEVAVGEDMHFFDDVEGKGV
ncbi:hypothetical protein HBH56_120580 [Parastagonospora nodorum]|uniref:Uncharacterized protein n=2 Tax=Phaeosphaeria nodorum (strain SN15 / ATCC MYA-4574 / FGSC 10173) TaxID=321614 RepID=A0A7U2FF21_PHANO|nr:hypothetical protein SNOG_13815 [Parastagonospora nodorum SN15]KAH3912019.1 hypothetical protein HBH56_120580 [Parastagonospora nodorum]EAT78839.2 hypothetical protein SNOG_13815 [Parastagonospora nodorum SN15]KAH3924237.1 hypothetical protein HBH54_196480 [Parastagonospora nodorum]KAH4046050.1 hypothetical protein HBH49_192740 [Parastagonospora nodorum]KAH4060222.1 hypothetical protein HBH50_223770 [Parastagonospora nodorum]